METDSRVNFQVNASHIVATGISDVGRVRSENEDSIWLDKSGLVLLLADGMGGHERGAEASQTVIKVFQEHLKPEVIKEEMQDVTALIGVPPEIGSLYTIIFRAVGQTANFLCERNQELKLERYMGTTIVGLVLVQDDHVLWFHIGDSRLYRWRDSTLKCITTDHSLHAEWEKAGRTGNEPPKNIITRVIGINPIVEADIEWDKRQKDDIFILCSDGLTDMITEEQVEDILKAGNDVDDIANLLVDAALAVGGKDNTSVIVCKV
ncbi:MAG: serine/threonine-protein phosphatase [Deltaproteobacteria bacterium]|nr:serine/threonine-protein phosphatase [Deltaproteobacteria bacterium]